MHTNFLVTCVGAYHDSGIGTGGLVLVHNEKAHVIDQLDSTGMFYNKEIYYRYIRSLKTLVGYDSKGFKVLLRLPESSDVHDIIVRDEEIICVATGTNEILFFSHTGKLAKSWKADGDKDAWHLNCLEKKDEKLFISAFGKFKEHRGWHTEGCKEKGFVMDVDTEEILIDRLSGPHHPRFYDGKWYVCNSNCNSIRIVDSNKHEREIDLGGFTRGLIVDENYIYVGVSANRKIDVNGKAKIKILDRETLIVVKEIEIPFPEIYEILVVGEELCANYHSFPANFKLNSENDNRVRHLEAQVELGLLELEKLTKKNKLLSEQVYSVSRLRRAINKMRSIFSK